MYLNMKYIYIKMFCNSQLICQWPKGTDELDLNVGSLKDKKNEWIIYDKKKEVETVNEHGRSEGHPANVGCSSFFRYMNDDESNHNKRRPKRKTWTREDNQLPPHCYFKSNP